MPNLGIHVYEKATAVSVPAVADVGIPFVVGLAPVQTGRSTRFASSSTRISSCTGASL